MVSVELSSCSLNAILVFIKKKTTTTTTKKNLAHAVKHEEVLSLSEAGIDIPCPKAHSKIFTCRFSLYS